MVQCIWVTSRMPAYLNLNAWLESQPLHFPSSFLWMHVPGVSWRWLKWFSFCHTIGRLRLNSRFLAYPGTAVVVMILWEVSQWMEDHCFLLFKDEGRKTCRNDISSSTQPYQVFSVKKHLWYFFYNMFLTWTQNTLVPHSRHFSFPFHPQQH